jgi:iduronate 2-sulfatase
MTGLRPDTTKSYSFDKTFQPFGTFPQHFHSNGYEIVEVGKIFHSYEFDSIHKNDLNFGVKKSDWYNYQNAEGERMPSTVYPDKNTPEFKFRDYLMASSAIKALKKLRFKDKPWFLGVGFKSPHTLLHYPFKYHEMYRNVSSVWEVDPIALRYPEKTPAIAYRCCAYDEYYFLNHEGDYPHNESHWLVDKPIDQPFSERVYKELMWSYSASITFVDAQLGRLLDALTEWNLWEDTTIILTADHGMQNGEKGIW